ncbi:ribonuclease H family protein [Amylibacter sp. SFDW26]|uniref:ACT domain-containing protein n=1 Tax=Amylibacter sp. SFDW26 TaxID=2652722 RepID=UPI0012622D6D|nr:ACT domain-containing protein [Amylibacter sp. SFDW26]KAB7613422.1 ribonuclease H family protein [Amylibacter sp. SFDW26]
MSGEMDLDTLIGSMEPVLYPEHYVFATTTDTEIVTRAKAKMVFEEAEGTTLIVLKEEAERLGLEGEFLCQMITLNIHSSLEAVGFMARIATHLSKLDMGVNPVAGFYHDHLFIQVEKVPAAMGGLRELIASV